MKKIFESKNLLLIKSIVKKYIIFFANNDVLFVNIIAIIGVLLSVWGFQVAYAMAGQEYNFLNSLYSTVRLFTFELDAPDLVNPLVWQVEASRWLIVFFMSYYIAKGILLIAKNQFELLKLKIFGGDHIVICGAGEKGKTLGLSWLKADPQAKIFYIEPDADNPNIPVLKEHGAIIIQGNANEISVLKKLQVQKSRYLITTTDSDSTNIEIISKVATADWKIDNKIKCFIHIVHNEFYDFFMARSFTESSKLEIKVFNVHTNAARMLYSDKKHLLGSNVFNDATQLKTSNLKVKIVIFGFEKLGESVLIHALNLGHFYNQTLIEVTVVYDQDQDKNANLLDEFNKHYDVIKHNGLYWNVIFMDDGDFQQENLADYSQVIIAYENEFESLSNLMKLLKKDIDTILSHNIDIAIYSNSFGSTAEVIQNDKPVSDNKHAVFKNVRTFGELDKTCSYDVVINEMLDQQASLNHAQYEALHNAKENGWATSWDDLSIFLKDSNRYLMEHNEIKKYMIDLLLQASTTQNDYEQLKAQITQAYFSYDCMNINWDKMELKNNAYTEKLMFNEIVQLGKVEHQRWNAFHILKGWKELPIPANAQEKIKKDPIRKLHPCLVSWEALDRVSENHQHDYKSDDIETVMRIPMLLNIEKNAEQA